MGIIVLNKKSKIILGQYMFKLICFEMSSECTCSAHFCVFLKGKFCYDSGVAIFV